VLPRRGIVERTWAWLVNHRHLRIDYERDSTVTAGFVWAAYAASPPITTGDPRWENLPNSH